MKVRARAPKRKENASEIYFSDDESPETILYAFETRERLKKRYPDLNEAELTELLNQVVNTGCDPEDIYYRDYMYVSSDSEVDDKIENREYGSFGGYSQDYNLYEDISRRNGRFGNQWKSLVPIGDENKRNLKVGLVLERWHKDALEKTTKRGVYDSPLEKSTNCIDVVSHESYVDRHEKCDIKILRSISLESLTAVFPEDADAIVMDPPFGYSYDESKFNDLLAFLKEKSPAAFILVWMDAEYSALVTRCFEAQKYYFSDSACVQLYDEFLAPLEIPNTSGLTFSSRMLMMYQHTKLARTDISQQRSQDVYFGISSKGQKSHGRYSMPLCAHQIVENMLPKKKNSLRRVFVELWPSRSHPRPGWVYIDEK